MQYDLTHATHLNQNEDRNKQNLHVELSQTKDNLRELKREVLDKDELLEFKDSQNTELKDQLELLKFEIEDLNGRQTDFEHKIQTLQQENSGLKKKVTETESDKMKIEIQ
eukprot:CAMPEP_0116995852 /NCGR_PEP_ID=MMETSP0467-20121206/69048_1 /TAXON_ID=283647 /ORGANISM="Mesodinium pulex, Strain SPMC105" /LENGTH=109 /DNA_ID=CAMNT_0004694341 /DNA_START=260 /DNA_END=589 /DNA_ORIENTATION=+